MPEKSLKTIAKNVREARIKAGLTQSELGTKADISTNYISRIERADASPTTDVLERIVKALKVKSSTILPF